MYLKSLYLRNFRNYTEAEIHFSEGLNVFYGDNAQGKTNLLEAIYIIATGRSFRPVQLENLIRSGESFFFLEAEIVKDLIQYKVNLFFDGKNKKLQIGATSYTSFSPLLGFLPMVIYTPLDSEMISGPPSERRRFLNLHLAQGDPLYVHHLTRFHRAMKQRNALLKAKTEDTIEFWEKEMALSTEYLCSERGKMVENLSVESLFQEKISLEMQISSSKSYLQQMQKSRQKEMDLGFTLVGPHRDDLLIYIDQKLAKLYASEGQKKSTLTSLKLAEWERLCASTSSSALFGLDDLESTLDSSRQNLLEEKLGLLGQVFITTPKKPTAKAHNIKIPL